MRFQRGDLLDLGFGRVDIVLAVPADWEDVNNAADLFKKFVNSTGTHPLRIWTEYLNLTEALVRKHTDLEPSLYSPYSRLHVERRSSSPVAVFHSFGATESKPPEDGDAIVDNTETGRTLRANGLKIIEKVLPSSTARLLVNRRSLRHREKHAIIQTVRKAMLSATPTRREAEARIRPHLAADNPVGKWNRQSCLSGSEQAQELAFRSLMDCRGHRERETSRAVSKRWPAGFNP